MAAGTILIPVEHRNGEIRTASWEALGAAERFCADLGMEMTALLMGNRCGQLADQVKARVPRLLCVDSEQLEAYTCERYLYVLEKLIPKIGPQLVLFPHTVQGMEVGASLAASLKSPYLPDCIELKREAGAWVGTRELFGGKLRAEYVPAEGLLTATLRAGVYEEISEKDRPGEVIAETVDFGAGTFRTDFLELILPESAAVDITKWDVLVGVGRGVGDKDKLGLFEDLAAAMGGTVAASRPVVDLGWLPRERQVGQSGKTVKPRLYLACGISGASQHLMGMKGSQTIVAINSDPKAPIFNVADVGIVGDMFEIVPRIIEECKARKVA
jgi:electron transfer flavoprotein alpha subunit